MLRRLFFIPVLVIGGLGIFAQTTREEVLSDLNRTGGVYYAYPVTTSENTAPPKGYEPVYISHYGRHGSRYLISDNDYKWVYDLLKKAKEANALTDLGLETFNKLDTLMTETQGRGGDLSPLGVRQHKAIAKRMYDAYPQVFKGDNVDISARSTLVVRCVLSMAAFCESLKEQNPNLKITRESSQRYMPYLCYHRSETGKHRIESDQWKEMYRRFKDSHTNPDRLVNSLFKDTKFVEMNVNPDELMWGFYWIASDMQDVETPMTFYNLFTPDELFDLWQCFNFLFYVNDSNFAGNDGYMVNNAKSLLENIIVTADECLAKETPGATLRFGHDGNLIPLAAIMRMKDCYNSTEDPNEVYKNFCDWKIAPMAGNIQLIFFRNKKNPKDVLVKFMLNEREISIPVETDSFPFYNWNKVKDFYNNEVIANIKD